LGPTRGEEPKEVRSSRDPRLAGSKGVTDRLVQKSFKEERKANQIVNQKGGMRRGGPQTRIIIAEETPARW